MLLFQIVNGGIFVSTKSVEIGKRIRAARELRKLTQSELGNEIGVTKSTVAKYEAGIVERIQLPMIEAIAKYLDVDPSWLALKTDKMGEFEKKANQKDFDIFSIPGILPLPKMVQKPLIGTIACGTPILAEQNIDSYIPVPDDIRCDFALRCEGDSMIGAHIMPGASVYIREQPDVENGEIAAVIIEDERATLKRVYKTDNAVTLMAENSSYAPIIITGEQLQHMRILGRVVAYTNYLL